MTTQDNQSEHAHGGEFQAFKELTRKILAVPKEEIEKKRTRVTKNSSKKSKPKPDK